MAFNEPLSGTAAEKQRELEKIALETLHSVIESSGGSVAPEKMSASRKRIFFEQIGETLNRVALEQGSHLSQTDKQKVIKYVTDEIFGYGPVNALLEDPTISEIMVNGCRQVYVERGGILYRTEVSFRDDAHLLHTIEKIISPLGRRIDESSPMVDARLPDGSRINAIIPPLAIKGPVLTIRKFAVEPFTLEDLISMGTITQALAAFLQSCVKARINIIVSGGAGSGKTTTLNILSGFIPNAERIITIEDAAELQLRQEHVVTLESRPPNIEGRGRVTIRDLVINSLRMRPDRIIVGEVRGGEALDMLQAMNTGHDGSISTLHANNPRDALSRLETMMLMAGMDLPLRAVREQIASAIGLIIHQARFPDGSRKIIKVSEVVGMERETITLQDIFLFRRSGISVQGKIVGSHHSTGIIPTFIDQLRAYGEYIPAELFEPPSSSEKSRRGF